MVRTLRSSIRSTVRDTVPFLLITLIWIVIMLAIYGAFLVTKPTGVEYGQITYVSVFVPPLIGFTGHVLREALRNE